MYPPDSIPGLEWDSNAAVVTALNFLPGSGNAKGTRHTEGQVVKIRPVFKGDHFAGFEPGRASHHGGLVILVTSFRSLRRDDCSCHWRNRRLAWPPHQRLLPITATTGRRPSRSALRFLAMRTTKTCLARLHCEWCGRVRIEDAGEARRDNDLLNQHARARRRIDTFAFSPLALEPE
jgi:hypothetical protein